MSHARSTRQASIHAGSRILLSSLTKTLLPSLAFSSAWSSCIGTFLHIARDWRLGSGHAARRTAHHHIAVALMTHGEEAHVDSARLPRELLDLFSPNRVYDRAHRCCQDVGFDVTDSRRLSTTVHSQGFESAGPRTATHVDEMCEAEGGAWLGDAYLPRRAGGGQAVG